MAKSTVRSAAIASWALGLLALGALATTHCGEDLDGEMTHTTLATQSAPVQDGALEEEEPAANEAPAEAPAPETRTQPPPLPTGEVFVPTQIFDAHGDALDRRVLEANPRVYLYEDYDPEAEHILIIGMPGWGGRSENYIWTLINGLKDEHLTRRLVVASIQDLNNGGPRYQGQGCRAHANIWSVTHDAVEASRRFISGLAAKLGHLEVYFMGFSTGGTNAAVLSTRVAESSPEEGFTVGGAISMGTRSPVKAEALLERKQRVLFLVVPTKRASDPTPLRDDQWNRISAEDTVERLAQAGAAAQLRHVVSARRHRDWHWGLVSQCRYFKTQRIDDGRGYWPNYWMPNPETMGYMKAFLLGEELPEEGANSAPQSCPY